MEIDSRLKKIIPDDESKKSKVQKLIDDAKILVDQAKAMLDEEVQKAREQGKAKWYRKFLPRFRSMYSNICRSGRKS